MLFDHPLFLRRVLFADALVSAGCALLLLAATTQVHLLTGLPGTLLRGAGAALVIYAAFVAYISHRQPLARGAVWLIATINGVWAIECIALMFTGWVQPTSYGIAFLVTQALVTAGFAELQVIGLRRAVRHSAV